MIDRPSVRETERLRRHLRWTQRAKALTFGVLLGHVMFNLGAYVNGGLTDTQWTIAAAITCGLTALGVMAVFAEAAVRRQIASLK